MTTILDRNGVIAYVAQQAAKYNIDPAAVLAVANHEGLNTTPGSSWTVGNEANISFGPPSWFGNGAGSALLQRFGTQAPAWSWSPAGIDYWLQSVAASGAAGLSGDAAIRAIVTGFERPRADLVQGEINNASTDYNKMQVAVGGAPTVTTTTAVDGTTAAVPATTGTAVGASFQAASIGGTPLNLPSGLILALLGVLLLILGAMLFGNQLKATVESNA